jgi:hypothetical protein
VLLDEALVADATSALQMGDRDAAAAGSRRRLEGIALLLELRLAGTASLRAIALRRGEATSCAGR